MISNSSMLRRTFDGVALFAVLNMLVLAGLVAYVVGAGIIDGEKVREIVGVIRADGASPGDVATATDSTSTEPAKTPAVVGGDALAEAQINLEIMRREAARVKAELEQRLALNNSILLRVMTEREAYQQERERAERREEASAEQRSREGFRKQIAIFESLSPKTGLQHLLAIPDPDEAVEILLAMDTRKAKAMIEAAKREEDVAKMKVILRRMSDAEPARSAELASKAP